MLFASGRTGLTSGVAVAIVWTVLALLRPMATFHFAPAVLAAFPALASGAGPAARELVVFGVVLAHLTTAGLALAHALRGPTFFGSSGAAAEAVVFAWLGGLLAWAIVGRRLPAVDPNRCAAPTVPAPVGAEGDEDTDQRQGDGGDHRPLEA